MICPQRDPDLLLYRLGELSPWQRCRTALHLRSCARCRARLAQLATVSDQIADALRPPQDGTGPGSGPGTPVPVRPLLPAFAPLLLLLLLGLLTVSVVTIRHFRARAAVHASARDEGCRPDLPSDQCR